MFRVDFVEWVNLWVNFVGEFCGVSNLGPQHKISTLKSKFNMLKFNIYITV